MLKEKLYFSKAIAKDHNNYNLIRLIASLAVIYGHSFFLFDRGGYSDVFKIFISSEYSGSLAVELFFFMSGIYIALSFVNSKTYIRFIIHRIFRIWPALMVCVLLTVFVLGYFLTGSFSYLHTFEPWKYIITNFVVIKGALGEIPGYFTYNRYPKSINGSLWTLKLELRCYFVLFILGVLGVFRSRPWLFFIVILFSAIILITNSPLGPMLMTDMLGIKLLIFFCIGSLTYYYRQYILIDWKLALLLFALSFVWAPIFYIFMLYGSLTFGASKVAKKIHLPGDYSYGVYIYGFVVQQTVAFYNPKIDAMHSCLIVIPITMFLGVLSWHFIELPAMNCAKRLSIKWESRNKIKAFVSA